MIYEYVTKVVNACYRNCNVIGDHVCQPAEADLARWIRTVTLWALNTAEIQNEIEFIELFIRFWIFPIIIPSYFQSYFHRLAINFHGLKSLWLLGERVSTTRHFRDSSVCVS